MTTLAKSNPFDQALSALEKDMPPTFQLAVDEHVFSRIPMTEAAMAVEISSAMENMKYKAAAMGYTVTTERDNARRQWVYSFTSAAPVKAVDA